MSGGEVCTMHYEYVYLEYLADKEELRKYAGVPRTPRCGRPEIPDDWNSSLLGATNRLP